MSSLHLIGRSFDGFEKAVAAHSEAWTGGSVQTRWLPLPALQELVLGPGPLDSDLLIVPADWLPALAVAGRIRPLPGQLADDWAPSFQDGVSYQDSLYGIPFHDGPQLLFTRPSLTPEPPATWSAFVAEAKALRRKGLERGTVLAGKPDGHNNVYDFVLQLWRFGGDLVVDDVITIDTPPARAALLFLREIVTELVGPDAHRLDSNASGQEFAEGRVGTMVNWAGYASMAQDMAQDMAHDVRCSLVPSHDDGTPTVTVNAFWATCVTNSSPQPDLARDYLRHAASPAMDLATTRAGASGARRSTWSDPDVLTEHPESALFAAAHANSRPLPRLPQLPDLVDVLNELVDAVVWRGEDLDAALART